MEWQRTEDKANVNPYKFRYICLNQKLDLTDITQRFILGRALYHLNQRRGFLSNRKESTKESEGAVKEGISTLEQLCQKSKAELQSIDKIGDITVMRIVNNLEKCGLHLGMSPFEINMYNRRKCREIVSRESFVTELERLLEEGNGDIRFVDRDLMLDDYAPEEDGEDGGECALHLSLNIHHNLHLPEKEAETIDWEARFYDIAKEEFLRQNRVFSDDEVRAHRAVAAASTFVEAMKAYQSKEKSNQ